MACPPTARTFQPMFQPSGLDLLSTSRRISSKIALVERHSASVRSKGVSRWATGRTMAEPSGGSRVHIAKQTSSDRTTSTVTLGGQNGQPCTASECVNWSSISPEQPSALESRWQSRKGRRRVRTCEEATRPHASIRECRQSVKRLATTHLGLSATCLAGRFRWVPEPFSSADPPG